ncbi:hypothetical protein MRB53_027570 [Persea americana]|uniref:Uncharacterized protein n=1 Tax=Persea americana TaxID=3435 RepID=A0ACC2LLC8_PERAE|nr:hypothetical protein MRB53_027570 [Persea americana]
MSRDGENSFNERVVGSGSSSKWTRVYTRRQSLDKDANVGSMEVVKPPHTNNSYVPPLSDDLGLLILARAPLLDHAKLCSVNKRYLGLLMSEELYKIRRTVGVKETLVFFLSSSEPQWWVINPKTNVRRIIPRLPSDFCFENSDKESLSVRNHLLVSGREVQGMVIWRYEFAMNKWFKGPSMINPRCLFASANCGDFAYAAGGLLNGTPKVSNLAEKYNPESKSWKPLPEMIRCRKLCSGCYMDKKFYAIGGIDEQGKDLTCGEFYDSEQNTWVLVPGMIKGAPSAYSRSPPLIAVANNELYSLDSVTNQLKVYLKKNNSWKVLGEAPIRANHSMGWGVAFKSLGDELIVMGSVEDYPTGRARMMMFMCCPDPGAHDLQWRRVGDDKLQRVGTNNSFPSAFIFNCAVMIA